MTLQKNIPRAAIAQTLKMHVHMNAYLTSLTLLHLSTYVSMHGHLNVFSWKNKEIFEEKP